MKKKRLLSMRLLVWVLLAVVALMDLLFVFTRARTFSPTENRSLQTFPRMTWRTLTSGRFEAQFDDYVADQFPLRDGWIRLKATADRLMGRTESNNVFLGKDGYLIQNFVEPDPANYAETIAALKDFSERHVDLPQFMLVAPSALTACADRLPMNAVHGDESGYMDRLMADLGTTHIRFVDVRDDFAQRAAQQQLYYRTDHHWTLDAAYAAYLKLSLVAGLSGSTEAYRRTLLSDSFSGTLTAASGFRMAETDPLYAYIPVNEQTYVVNYVEEGQRSASVYQSARLKERDQYTVFFGGNHSQVKIDTAREEGRVMLVLKDSYANCFVPFLIPDCKRVVMVDPRYYTGDLDVLIEAEGVTDILLLYNANTLASDAALKRDLLPESLRRQ